MRLRPFGLVITLALGLLAAPLPAVAKQAREVYRIGSLGPYDAKLPGLRAFLDEMRNLGWVEHENFVMEYRISGTKFERLPDLAAELVALEVDVILTATTLSTHAAKKTTSTIPIVFTLVADPIGDGFVTSFARPGGNITGVSNAFVELSGKVVELAVEAVPGTSRVAYLWNRALGPARLARRILKEIEDAAQALGAVLHSVGVWEDKGFEPAFEAITRARPDALIVHADPLADKHRARIVDFSLTHRLPLIAHGRPGWPEAGALMSYTPDYPRQFRRAAHLVDKILKGAKPADLPVELPTNFNLTINMKTAKALGLTIPPSVLVRVNRVIE